MKKMIDDAIYRASPEITRHRYNPLLGILLTAGSIVLLWANSNGPYLDEHELLSQWNLLISSCLLCTGLTMVCYRFFGDSSAPVEKKSRKRLYRSEFPFEAGEMEKVKAAVERGDFTLLQNLPRCYNSSSHVVCYRTDSGSMIAAQILANREPVGDIRVFHAGEYAF